MKQWIASSVRWLLVICGGLVIVITVLPALETNQWWVRIWDYPRVQIGVAGTLVSALLLLIALHRRNWLQWLCACVALSAAFQIWRILPYTPIWPREMVSAEHRDGTRCTSVKEKKEKEKKKGKKKKKK